MTDNFQDRLKVTAVWNVSAGIFKPKTAVAIHDKCENLDTLEHSMSSRPINETTPNSYKIFKYENSELTQHQPRWMLFLRIIEETHWNSCKNEIKNDY